MSAFFGSSFSASAFSANAFDIFVSTPSFSSAAFSKGAFSQNAFWFEQAISQTVDQPSNWQADYWKHKPKSKRERDEDDRLERISLGILPPDEQADAMAAVREAMDAAQLAGDGSISPIEHTLRAMQARDEYERIYQEAFKETYIAEAVAEQWRSDMKKLTRRRKAAMLLLH